MARQKQKYGKIKYGTGGAYSASTTPEVAGGAAYGEIEYNENLYNAAILVLGLAEAVSLTDADQTEDVNALRQDVLTMLDTIVKVLNNDPFLDEIMLIDDTLVKDAVIAKLESITPSDQLTTSFIKTLIDSMTISDVRTLLPNLIKVDAVFLDDFLKKEISNKGLPETLRLAAWLTVKRNPAQNNWGD